MADTRAPSLALVGRKNVTAQRWQAPLYWVNAMAWWHLRFRFFRPVDESEPCNLSYSKPAPANWAGARLPTSLNGTRSVRLSIEEFVENEGCSSAPAATRCKRGTHQLVGELGWTAGPIRLIPGSRRFGAPASTTERSWQPYVLRVAPRTSSTHIRRTYRAFFPPENAAIPESAGARSAIFVGATAGRGRTKVSR